MIAANPKIEALMLAIAKHEGWHETGSKSHENGSVAYRNHNPGNLRASPFARGKKDGFAVFRNDFVGFMALHWDLMQKARGNTVTKLGPKSTLRDLIFVYAPPSDNNNSQKYLEEVMRATGFKATITLQEIFENSN
jgi:hypothetical protein